MKWVHLQVPISFQPIDHKNLTNYSTSDKHTVVLVAYMDDIYIYIYISSSVIELFK